MTDAIDYTYQVTIYVQAVSWQPHLLRDNRREQGRWRYGHVDEASISRARLQDVRQRFRRP